MNAGRDCHPDGFVRRRLWTIWLLHCGLTREKASPVVGLARSTVERFVAEYRRGGLSGLLQRRPAVHPTSDLSAHAAAIRESFEQRPVRTVAEARQRIFEWTGIQRGLTQVRVFLKGLGLTWQRVRAIPVPPKKTSPNTQPTRPPFTMAS